MINKLHTNRERSRCDAVKKSEGTSGGRGKGEGKSIYHSLNTTVFRFKADPNYWGNNYGSGIAED